MSFHRKTIGLLLGCLLAITLAGATPATSMASPTVTNAATANSVRTYVDIEQVYASARSARQLRVMTRFVRHTAEPLFIDFIPSNQFFCPYLRRALPAMRVDTLLWGEQDDTYIKCFNTPLPKGLTVSVVIVNAAGVPRSAVVTSKLPLEFI